MTEDRQADVRSEVGAHPQSSSSQPVWAQALGCAGGLAALTFFLLFFLASCTAKTEADGSVSVIDTADLLSAAAESAIGEIRFPPGTPVVVRSVESIPLQTIGSYATGLMDDGPEWQTLRPRGFLRRYIRQDSPSAPGVLVVVSRDPHLLQIRFGHDVRLAAYEAGLAAGPWYRMHQEFGNDQEIVATVRELADRMKTLVHPWWLLSWARYVSSFVSSEVEDYLAPSDGLYSHWILANYLSLANRAGATGSPWRFIAFGAAFFIVLWLVGKKLLVQRLLLPRAKRAWIRFSLLAVTNVGLVGTLLTGFAALALLSKGRMEDELALSALGLSFLSPSSFGAGLFSASGGLWIAVPGAIVSFIGEVLQSAENSRQEALRDGTQSTTLTFGWLAWGCALYLLPLSVAIPALLVLIWSSGSDVVAAVSAE